MGGIVLRSGQVTETIGDRIREIREQCNEKQPEFAARLNTAAARLGIEARYDNTIVSKMEVGRRDVGLVDVQVIASVDPSKRGREWLAWGERPGAILLDPKLDRGLTEAEEQRALRKAEQTAAAQKPSVKGRRRSGSA